MSMIRDINFHSAYAKTFHEKLIVPKRTLYMLNNIQSDNER